MARRRRGDSGGASESVLLAELDRMREERVASERIVHDLEVHQEELRIQHAQLIESQNALEESYERYADLFDFSPVGYVVTDRNGVIVNINLAGAELIGVERHRLVGDPLVTRVHRPDRKILLDHLLQCRSGAPRVECDLSLRTASATSVPVRLITSPARGRTIPVGAFHTTIIDLTAQRRAESERTSARAERQALSQSEQIARAANETKDRFIATLSHELRTPLSPILFALDSLTQRGSVPAWMQPTLEMVRRNVLLETRLIEDLLDITRIVQGRMSLKPDTVDLHQLVDDIALLCRQDLDSPGLDFRIEPRAAQHHTRADPVRLHQVVWNLLQNALRNTPLPGGIRIETSNPSPEHIELSVVDSGRGIAPAHLRRIFELFEQDEDARRRGVGLGIGLAISRSIVAAHGGTLEAHSNGPGTGARFTLSLRTVAAPQPAHQEALPVIRSHHSRSTILLVEDNEDTAAAMAELLRLHGYEVQLAMSVAEALTLADKADVLISDIALPDGTGLDLVRQVAARHPMRAIALSGYGSPDDIRRSTAAGFAHHLVKPVEPDRLLEAIQLLTSRP